VILVTDNSPVRVNVFSDVLKVAVVAICLRRSKH